MGRDTGNFSESRTSSTRPRKTQYRLIEDVEDLDRYRPGGYHPLQIGDELDRGHYRLVDKLGYGGYSTIWLARDLRKAGYVAVKVITADASDSNHEASLINSLQNSPSRRGSDIIAPLVDEFWVAGPNGKHRCIVTPPAQMSLFDAREASTLGLFRPNVAQSIVAQLIHGVAFLHSENIVHGDIHLGNILIQFPEAIDRFSTSDLYERFGEPEPEAVVRIDGKPLQSGVPVHVFIPAWFGVRSDKIVLGEEKIILSDFGESFNPHKAHRPCSKTLPLLQPPEARFSDQPLSFASDIWTLACTIWEIFGQRPLFEAFFPTADRVIKEQVEVLGILPPEWWGKWSRRLDWFNEEAEFDLRPETSRGHDGVRRTWDQRFDYSIQEPRAEAGLETVTKEERRAFEAMLRSMLSFRPNERATALQALHSEWMKRWGLPALEQSESIFKSVMKGKHNLQD
ncbi:CMGC/SRPK protein kinase [Xylona heveae TC161]|uniref:non-specific serine/threonine protein kinase n=1 Tax=Xylona heveae (strain CBS 132557 / TC161) TaxID=1328760 RepID=A0A165A6W9_XYLHT|nr:CMGC/SRPK protein kinase [Xylona heveae TC161]KZF20039.1 CMGC/SRPK protein kinase [Xylona heveae TC161]